MKQRQEMDFVRGVKTKCRGFAGVLSGRNTAATCTCSITQYGPGITFERRCQASTPLAHACPHLGKKMGLPGYGPTESTFSSFSVLRVLGGFDRHAPAVIRPCIEGTAVAVVVVHGVHL